jgi:hypothetical protein
VAEFSAADPSLIATVPRPLRAAIRSAPAAAPLPPGSSQADRAPSIPLAPLPAVMPAPVVPVQAPQAHVLVLARGPVLEHHVRVASGVPALVLVELRQPAKHRVLNVPLRGVVAAARSIPRPRKAR